MAALSEARRSTSWHSVRQSISSLTEPTSTKLWTWTDGVFVFLAARQPKEDFQMSHTYVVTSCTYTTIGDPNPFCFLAGTVDGVPVNPACGVFYHLVAQANAIGGSAAVKLVLAPALLNGITTPLDGHTLPGPPFVSGPVYSAAVSPATPGTNVSVAAALVGSW